VHPDNPRTRITLPELDAIYSADRRCGGRSALRRWDALAAPERSAVDRLPILAIGRDTGSGTHGLFRELALCGGPYQPQVIAWPGNGAIVAAVASNPEAIGYAGAGYANGLVRTLAVARDGANEAILPDERAVASGRYPLSRALHVYVNRAAGEPLAALPAAFLQHALSDAAQARVRGAGFVPLTEAERLAQRALLAP
jgi:phosphate transport system substrate-binding protein